MQTSLLPMKTSSRTVYWLIASKALQCFECMLIFPIQGQQVSSLYNTTSSKGLIERTHEGCLRGFVTTNFCALNCQIIFGPRAMFIVEFGSLVSENWFKSRMQTAIPRHSEVKTEFCRREKYLYQDLLNRFWGLPRDPENTFELSNNKLPLSATVN